MKKSLLSLLLSGLLLLPALDAAMDLAGEAQAVAVAVAVARVSDP